MLDLKLALAWLWANKTKVFGYIQVTLGVLATASNVLSDTVVQFIVLLSGLMTAWIGHYNTTKQRELEEALATAQGGIQEKVPPNEFRNLAVLLGFFFMFTLLVPTASHAAIVGENDPQWQVADGTKGLPGHNYETIEECWAAYAIVKAELAKTRTSGTLYLGCQKKAQLKFGPNPPPVPVNCVVDAWSAWSACTNHTQTRTRGVLTAPANGGTACPVLTQTQACNSAPTIAGTPPPTGKVGTAYAFAPTSSDKDGDTLAFTIANKPSWAAFSSSTGRLSGTPSAPGLSNNIVITASDGTAAAQLAAFGITITQDAAGSATLSWIPPTQNVDGSPLTDLAGYRVVWGTVNALTNVIDVPGAGITSYVVQGLKTGSWSFAVRAYTAAGAESQNSNTASKLIQ